MERPFQLIFFRQSKFYINTNVTEILKNELRPITVVSMVGSSRSGKSYLLNLLGDLHLSGFPLGSTIEGKTKGIWMWIGDFPGNASRALVLLDTEGLGDPKEIDPKKDYQLTFLSMLLSSVFVYNTKGVIDEKSLDSLSLAIKCKDITRAETDDIVPCFVWTLRDFCLNLERDGQTITSNDYLELSIQKKQTLKEVLTSRHCFVFPSPTDDQEMSLHLDELPTELLNENFQSTGQNFKRFILQTANSKRFFEDPVDGVLLSLLIETYVELLNSGTNFNVTSVYNYVKQVQNEEVMKSILSDLNLRLVELRKIFPVSLEALQERISTERKNALDIFKHKTRSQREQPEFEHHLETKLRALFDEVEANNAEAAERRCLTVITSCYEMVGLENKLGRFSVLGGVKLLRCELEKFKSSYEKDAQTNQLSFIKEKVMEQFWKSKCLPLLDKITKIESCLQEHKNKLKDTESDRISRIEKKKILLIRKKKMTAENVELQKSLNEMLAKRIEELTKKHQQEIETVSKSLSPFKSLFDVEDFISNFCIFSPQEKMNLAEDIWEISNEYSKRTRSFANDVLIKILDQVCHLLERPTSWKSYLTDLFNEICFENQAKIAAVLRERESAWACDGVSSFDRLNEKSFSNVLIETIKSTKESVLKKARKFINYFLKSKSKKIEEDEQESELDSESDDSETTMKEDPMEQGKEINYKQTNKIQTRFKASSTFIDDSINIKNKNLIGANFNAKATCADISTNMANVTAVGANFNASATFDDESTKIANVTAAGVNASASAKWNDNSTNFANVNAAAASASASAKLSDDSVNILNVSATGASASASFKAADRSTNIANVNVKGVSASATATVNSRDTSIGNVNISGPSVGAHFEFSPEARRFGNVNIQAPSASVSVGFSGPSAGNLSIGGGMGIELNPLNWFTNFGLGGGGGGGGGGSFGEGGNENKDSESNQQQSNGLEGKQGCGLEHQNGGQGGLQGAGQGQQHGGGQGGHQIGGRGEQQVVELGGQDVVGQGVQQGGGQGGQQGCVQGYQQGGCQGGQERGGQGRQKGGGKGTQHGSRHGGQLRGGQRGQQGECDGSEAGTGAKDEKPEKGRNGVIENEEDREALELAAQILREQGYENVNMSEIYEEVSDDESDDDEPFELCKFCKPKGCPCCMKCLAGKGSKKIVKIDGNIHGFAP